MRDYGVNDCFVAKNPEVEMLWDKGGIDVHIELACKDGRWSFGHWVLGPTGGQMGPCYFGPNADTFGDRNSARSAALDRVRIICKGHKEIIAAIDAASSAQLDLFGGAI